ncbi:hypothetical protein H5410_056789, partial [Solanum commersonii]
MASKFKALELDATLTLTKKNIMHNFTHRFGRIFQSTFKLPKIISRDSITQLTGPTRKILGSIMHSSQ